jgi:hypothetical protein
LDGGVLAHVERLETVCADYGADKSLLAVALQYVVQHPGGIRDDTPEQAVANVDAILEPVSEACWQAIEPLVRELTAAVPAG